MPEKDMIELVPLEEYKEKKKNDNKKLKVEFKEGDIVEGRVVKITNYGAFVKISKDSTGLVHISEISWDRISDIKNILDEGQEVMVKIIKIDGEKIGLSIKQLNKRPKNKNIRNKNKEKLPEHDTIAERLNKSQLKKLKKLIK